jgi:Rps23 Pro-64 3,4-dihydroxylase Tpa1-like proline 4-hydroxylase
MALSKEHKLSLDLQLGDKDAASPRGLMPPYLVLRDFLDETTVAGLFAFALSKQSHFIPTRIASKAIDPAIRVSKGLRELGAYRSHLKVKILGLLPELIARLRVTPFQMYAVELELVAHGDGAFYKRHTDTQTAVYNEVDRIRVLSGVYYFNAEPKAFAGGALRLYAIGGRPEQDFVDIEPLHNSLLVFPSWAPHEVMPVHCPSQRFIDSRFAINCWVHRKKADVTIHPREAGADKADP